MADYDFSSITDKEFEALSVNLLSAEDGVRYERFKPGRDAGVDGRFFRPDAGEVILQCKHWVNSPLERLLNHLKRVELPKIEKLNPTRYRLALSHPLSRHEKTKITSLLAPYVRSPSDILGREDLNDLLARHPDVERRHYNLWISSTTVLLSIRNKAILDRSDFAVDEIVSAARLYVTTENHNAALEKLKDLGVVIITGPAGIGKTTLAQQLALHYIQADFQFLQVVDDLQEAERAYEDKKKQIFYFDDFLGQNYLEALTGNFATHIGQFIRRVTHDRTKRFILTSRSTILNQGRILSDVFNNQNLKRNEFEISIESLRPIDKAKILYNHIWHSTLPRENIDVIFQDKRYRRIIWHDNFNPRLIRFITDGDRMSSVPPAQYWERILALLKNPADVWANPFEAQIDDCGRAMVLLVALNGRSITQPALSDAYSRFLALPCRSGSKGRRDFLLNLQHLCGSLLSRILPEITNPEVRLFNPSLGDYLFRRYASDAPSLRDGYSSLRSVSSLHSLKTLRENKIVSETTVDEILSHIIRNATQDDFVGYSIEYIATVCLMSCSSSSTDVTDNLYRSCAEILLEAEPFLDVETHVDAIRLLHKRSIVSAEEAERFLERSLAAVLTSQDLFALWHLSSSIDEIDEATLAKLHAASLEHLENNAADEFPPTDVFHSIGPGDVLEAEESLRAAVTAKLDDFGMKATTKEIERIVTAYDVPDRIAQYWDSIDFDDPSPSRTASYERFDEIDDLFEREDQG